MPGELLLASGMRLALTPGSCVTLGRQHVRLSPAATAVARVQCQVTVSAGGDAVFATSKGVNPTAVLTQAGRVLLRQGAVKLYICC